jgi:hypothetical protein
MNKNNVVNLNKSDIMYIYFCLQAARVCVCVCVCDSACMYVYAYTCMTCSSHDSQHISISFGAWDE